MKSSVEGLVCLVFIQFLSFLCALYVLIHCIKEKSTYRSSPNHLIICLLIVSTWMISIDLFTTEFFIFGMVSYQFKLDRHVSFIIYHFIQCPDLIVC